MVSPGTKRVVKLDTVPSGLTESAELNRRDVKRRPAPGQAGGQVDDHEEHEELPHALGLYTSAGAGAVPGVNLRRSAGRCSERRV